MTDRFDDLDPVAVATAAILTATTGIGSASMVAGRIHVDYTTACRIMDALESAGIVGPPIGGGIRAVLVDTEATAATRIAMWLTNR